MSWRPIIASLVLVAAVLHGATLLRAWDRIPDHGADFASYVYAARVAAAGGDPYDTSLLRAAAREEGIRPSVHPFFYPPPFLLSMTWTAPLPLGTAHRIWFWLDALAAVLVGLVLWRWWRPLGASLPVVLAAAVATCTAIPNNHLMGQVNLPVLLLVLLGLWQADRGRGLLGGALVGAACMAKMSPALFVFWWVLRGRWRPALAALGAGALLTLLTLPLVGPEAQVGFYTRVLPTFGSGDYHGLTVPIGLFGNHSIPDLYHRIWPGSPRLLSPTAQTLSALTTVTLLGALAWLFRRPPADLWARAGQVSAVAVALLLVPVYTYEHHLVWALPAVVLGAVAVLEGRLARGWALPLGAAWAFWALDLALLRTWAGQAPAWEGVLREAKFGALVVLLLSSVALGARSRYLGARGGT